MDKTTSASSARASLDLEGLGSTLSRHDHRGAADLPRRAADTRGRWIGSQHRGQPLGVAATPSERSCRRGRLRAGGRRRRRGGRPRHRPRHPRPTTPDASWGARRRPSGARGPPFCACAAEVTPAGAILRRARRQGGSGRASHAPQTPRVGGGGGGGGGRGGPAMRRW